MNGEAHPSKWILLSTNKWLISGIHFEIEPQLFQLKPKLWNTKDMTTNKKQKSL